MVNDIGRDDTSIAIFQEIFIGSNKSTVIKSDFE
jgi:hypothetical protein